MIVTSRKPVQNGWEFFYFGGYGEEKAWKCPKGKLSHQENWCKMAGNFLTWGGGTDVNVKIATFFSEINFFGLLHWFQFCCCGALTRGVGFHLDLDPATFDVCWVQPITEPDHVLSR